MNYQSKNVKGDLEWPYLICYDKLTHVKIDVLIVGGGLAGSCAGIQAARRGAKVAVADKAPIERSGCGGAGMDHWNNVLDYPGSPMTPEENMEKGVTQGRQGHRDYIALKGTWDALMELEALGLPIRDEDGDFTGCATKDHQSGLLKAYDYRELIAVKLRGGQYIKPVLYEGLKKEGVQLFERCMITCLLNEHGKLGARIAGAVGFSMETGEFYVFHAKSVIIASGYACTLWTYNTEITGNSYRWDPNEIGEGLAMAWKAGAQVVGMYKNGHTKAATPFAWPRFGIGNPTNTWFPCSIVDNKGKEIPWQDADGNILTSAQLRNYPTKHQIYCGSSISDDYKKITLPNLISDLPERIEDGEYELPLWADLSGMAEDERRSIWGMMIGNEGKTRYTIFDLYTRMGFNPDKDMLMAPVMEPEGYKSGGWFQGEPGICKAWRAESFGRQGEIAVDWNLMTNIGGLFAAGACSGLEGCSYACSSGFYAGNRAAEYAMDVSWGELDEAQWMQERERVYAPIRRMDAPDAAISWKELWGGSARVMQQCCANFLSRSTLELGLYWLDSIKKNEVRHTYARNPHELARVLEDSTRITVSEMFLHGCLAQLGARASDIKPGTYIFQQLTQDGIVNSFKEPDYWLKAPYAPDYLDNYVNCRSSEMKVMK